MLRDLVRKISNGNENFVGKNVGLVDERGEIASVVNGVCMLDVGKRTDVMSNCSKDYGIRVLVRSMGIDVVATDEIGSKEDIDAIYYASTCGVSLLFTMHGNSIEDLINNKKINEMIKNKMFENIVFLNKDKSYRINKVG